MSTYLLLLSIGTLTSGSPTLAGNWKKDVIGTAEKTISNERLTHPSGAFD